MPACISLTFSSVSPCPASHGFANSPGKYQSAPSAKASTVADSRWERQGRRSARRWFPSEPHLLRRARRGYLR